MPTALVLDDEQLPRSAVQHMLQRRGWNVLVAANVDDAKLMLRHVPTVHLILVDVMMKEERGTDAVRVLETIAPGARVVLMSGYAPEMLESSGVTIGEAQFLQKPIDGAHLDAVLREIR